MQDNPIILALECACGPTSVALWQNGHILGYLEDSRPSSQAARLFPMLEELLSTATTSYADIAALAATIGPGSFTGIRVGLAAAGGICFAGKKPGFGATTLEVTAYGAKDQGETICAILRAGKGEWYSQLFKTQPHWHAISEPIAAKPEIIIETAPNGTVWAGNVEHEAIDIVASQPRADILAMLAAEKKEPLPLTPLYIRAPDATLPHKKL